MAEVNTEGVAPQPTAAPHESWLNKLNPFKKRPQVAPASPIASAPVTPMGVPTSPAATEAPAPAPTTPTPVKA